MAPPQATISSSLPADKASKCLAAMLRITLTDHRDGSHRLFVCACRAVEHDLDDATALATISQYASQRPFPRGWTDQEILQRLRDAEKQCRRGAALELDADGCVPLGQRDPQSGKLVLSPRRTLPTADAYVRDFHLHPDGRTLHCHAGMLMAWQHNRYAEIEDNAVKKQLQSWLHDGLRYVFNRQTGELELVPYDSNPGNINAALESIRAFAHLPVTVTSPSWLDNIEDRPPANEILPCRSALVHLPTMRQLPPTPRFFSVSALDFNLHPRARVVCSDLQTRPVDWPTLPRSPSD